MDDISLDSSWRERLEALGGTRRAAAWATAGLAAVAVAAGVLLTRPAPAQIAPPARAETAGTVLVHVAGAVRRGGLYELPVGARVADAVDAAGGPGRRADLDALNLAAPVTDGSRIEVPRRAPGGSATPAAASPTPGGPAPVSVNSADAATLETIPGIGPVKAAAIIAHRDEHGPFATVDDLLDVTGIGPATLEQLRPYVSL